MAKFLVTSEVSELLRVGEGTVRQWARQGVLPSVRVGRKVLFDQVELVEFVKGLRGNPNSSEIES